MEQKYQLIIIAAFLLLLLMLNFYKPLQQFYIDSEGRAHYPAERGALKFSEEFVAEDDDYRTYGVIFGSNGTDVHSMLWLPKNIDGKAPAILFLPGAGGEKTSGKTYSDLLRGKGIAIFALDQRGFGETETKVPESLQEEYDDFLAGREYFQLLMVYDALRAFDYLRQRIDIDGNKIIILGESMGGRNAIIAGALDSRFRAIIGISTGGYGLPQAQNSNATRFLRSFDPDNYIQLISPRKTVIFHSEADRVQPFEIGLRTYDYAKDPRVFYRAVCATHGLCDEMKPLVMKEIEEANR